MAEAEKESRVSRKALRAVFEKITAEVNDALSTYAFERYEVNEEGNSSALEKFDVIKKNLDSISALKLENRLGGKDTDTEFLSLLENSFGALEKMRNKYLGSALREQEDSDGRLSKLYRADGSLNDFLQRKRVELELAFDTDDEQKISALNKHFGFNKIVRHFNPVEAVSTYSVNIYPEWSHTNDPMKVYKKLDEECAVWSNAYRAKSLEILNENKKLDKKFIAQEMHKIEEKILLANKTLEELKARYKDTDFIDMEVRVIARNRAKEYPHIFFSVNGKRVKKNLSILVPNVVYYEEAEYAKIDKSKVFLDSAVNAFGDVYFIDQRAKDEHLVIKR